jgi:hypothetical protein
MTPETTLIIVVFPEPFGPITARMSPPLEVHTQHRAARVACEVLPDRVYLELHRRLSASSAFFVRYLIKLTLAG